MTVSRGFPSADGAFVQIDLSGSVTHANRSFGELLGLNKTVGRRFRDLLSLDSRKRWDGVRQAVDQSDHVIERLSFFNGTTAHVRFSWISDGAICIHGEVLSSGRHACLNSIKSALSSGHGEGSEEVEPDAPPEILRAHIRRLQARLADMEKSQRKDLATGLLSREHFYSQIETDLAQMRADQSSCLLAMVAVNGSWAEGGSVDSATRVRILRHIAKRIRASANVLSAARIGEEKFAVLARIDTGDAREVAAGMSHLISRLTRPVQKRWGTWRVDAAIGVSVAKAAQIDRSDLYSSAALALKEARRGGPGTFVMFDEELAETSRRARILESDLRVAVHENLLYPVYQPILSVRPEARIRVEVLARWTHYEYGNITPDEFIEIAVQSGLMSKLDLSITAAACDELRPLFLSQQIELATFNMSPVDLRDMDHVRHFMRIVHSSGIDPRNICIEITEQHFVGDYEAVRTALTYLKGEGVSIVIDDYGTGYSNLKALIDLPIDAIKIDKSLTSNVVEDRKSALAVLSVTSLGRLLGLRLAAEGVETPAQAAVLSALGCQFMQGYLYARPMRVAELGDWLRRRQKEGTRKAAGREEERRSLQSQVGHAEEGRRRAHNAVADH